MNFLTRLRKAAEQNQSIACLGLDPFLDRIPLEGKPEERIVNFFSSLLDAMASENTRPGLVKPNYACFATYGFPGLRALKRVIALCHKQKYLVLLDAKRGETGKQADACANEVFGFWKADAVTLVPYFGTGSVDAFLNHCDSGKGVYILNRISNHSATEFEDLVSDGIPFFMRISHKIIDWYKPGIGAVVEPKDTEELETISSFYVHSRREISLLLPEIGRHSSTSDLVAALRQTNNELAIHRISSSEIPYAYEKEKSLDYAGVAVKALRKLNQEIGFKVES